MVSIAESLLAPALACVDYFYARMFRDWPDAVTRTVGDCTLSYSGDTQLTGANHLWPTTADAITPGTLAAASKFFAPYHAAWSVVYTDPFMPGAAALLAECDYSLRWNSPLMVLDGPPHRYPQRISSRSGRVVRVTQPHQLIDVSHIMAEAFATTYDVNQRVARPEHLNDPAILHYLIYHDDEPATCATVAVHDGMAGVWNVGTRRRFRGHGYATRLMLALLDDLADGGVHASMLMASPSGQPIYEKLGYRQIGVTMYMRPPYFSFVR